MGIIVIDIRYTIMSYYIHIVVLVFGLSCRLSIDDEDKKIV